MTKYFVSYSWNSDRQSGHGCVCIELQHRITAYSSIKEILKYLNDTVKDKYGGEVECIVLNYKRIAWWSL